MEILIKIFLEIFWFLIIYGTMIAYMMNVPRILHYMQLDGYKNNEFTKWLTKNPKLAFKSGAKQLIAVAGFYAFITIVNLLIKNKFTILEKASVIFAECLGIVILFTIINVVQAFRDKKVRREAKKPLVYTARAKRLMFWNVATIALLEVSFLGAVENKDVLDMYMNSINKILYYSFFIFLIPVNMIIANFLASPTENLINERYISSARRKLKKKEYKNLIKIGITGSYRKNKYKIYIRNNIKRKI